MERRTRKAIRLGGRNYSSEGMYYVTICTEAMQYLLGHKEGDSIQLTAIGQFVKQAFLEINTRYDGVVLDCSIVMPNHVHGIITIHNDDSAVSLPGIIRNFKSYTTREYFNAKFRTTPNLWHRGYYERIIRFNELDEVRAYILKNPANWENDRFFLLEKLHQDEIRNKA